MKKILLSSAALVAIAVSPALSADFTVPEGLPAPEPVVEDLSWNGFYLGGEGGFRWEDRDDPSRLCDALDDRDEISDPVEDPGQVGDNSVVVGPNEFGLPEDLAGLFPAYSCRPFETINADGDPGDGNNDGVGVFDDDTSGDDHGWVAGGFVGVNRQYGRLVIGTELEGLWLDENEQTREFNFAYFEDSSNLEFLRIVGGGTFETEGPEFIVDATVKLGGAFGSMGQALLYVKGGFAVGDRQRSSFEGDTDNDCEDCGGTTDGFDGFTGDDSATSGYGLGPTAGVGIDYKLTRNFSIGGEYQYTFLNYFGEHSVEAEMHRDSTEDVRVVKFTNDFEDLQLHTFKVRGTLHLN